MKQLAEVTGKTMSMRKVEGVLADVEKELKGAVKLDVNVFNSFVKITSSYHQIDGPRWRLLSRIAKCASNFLCCLEKAENSKYHYQKIGNVLSFCFDALLDDELPSKSTEHELVETMQLLVVEIEEILATSKLPTKYSFVLRRLFASLTRILVNSTVPHQVVLGIATLLASLMSKQCNETREYLWKKHSVLIESLAKRLATCGDYGVQLVLSEILTRLADKIEDRDSAVRRWFAECPSLIKPFLTLGTRHFEMECRSFLNTLNLTSDFCKKPQVYSVFCELAFIDKTLVFDNQESKGAVLYLDVNLGSESLSLTWIPTAAEDAEEQHPLAKLRVSNTDVVENGQLELSCLPYTHQAQLRVPLLEELPSCQGARVAKLMVSLDKARELAIALRTIFNKNKMTVDAKISKLMQEMEEQDTCKSKKANDSVVMDATQCSGSFWGDTEFVLDEEPSTPVQGRGRQKVKHHPTPGPRRFRSAGHEPSQHCSQKKANDPVDMDATQCSGSFWGDTEFLLDEEPDTPVQERGCQKVKHCPTPGPRRSRSAGQEPLQYSSKKKVSDPSFNVLVSSWDEDARSVSQQASRASGKSKVPPKDKVSSSQHAVPTSSSKQTAAQPQEKFTTPVVPKKKKQCRPPTPGPVSAHQLDSDSDCETPQLEQTPLRAAGLRTYSRSGYQKKQNTPPAPGGVMEDSTLKKDKRDTKQTNEKPLSPSKNITLKVTDAQKTSNEVVKQPSPVPEMAPQEKIKKKYSSKTISQQVPHNKKKGSEELRNSASSHEKLTTQTEDTVPSSKKSAGQAVIPAPHEKSKQLVESRHAAAAVSPADQNEVEEAHVVPDSQLATPKNPKKTRASAAERGKVKTPRVRGPEFFIPCEMKRKKSLSLRKPIRAKKHARSSIHPAIAEESPDPLTGSQGAGSKSATPSVSALLSGTPGKRRLYNPTADTEQSDVTRDSVKPLETSTTRTTTRTLNPAHPKLNFSDLQADNEHEEDELEDLDGGWLKSKPTMVKSYSKKNNTNLNAKKTDSAVNKKTALTSKKTNVKNAKASNSKEQKMSRRAERKGTDSQMSPARRKSPPRQRTSSAKLQAKALSRLEEMGSEWDNLPELVTEPTVCPPPLTRPQTPKFLKVASTTPICEELSLRAERLSSQATRPKQKKVRVKSVVLPEITAEEPFFCADTVPSRAEQPLSQATRPKQRSARSVTSSVAEVALLEEPPHEMPEEHIANLTQDAEEFSSPQLSAGSSEDPITAPVATSPQTKDNKDSTIAPCFVLLENIQVKDPRHVNKSYSNKKKGQSIKTAPAVSNMQPSRAGTKGTNLLESIQAKNSDEIRVKNFYPSKKKNESVKTAPAVSDIRPPRAGTEGTANPLIGQPKHSLNNEKKIAAEINASKSVNELSSNGAINFAAFKNNAPTTNSIIQKITNGVDKQKFLEKNKKKSSRKIQETDDVVEQPLGSVKQSDGRMTGGIPAVKSQSHVREPSKKTQEMPLSTSRATSYSRNPTVDMSGCAQLPLGKPCCEEELSDLGTPSVKAPSIIIPETPSSSSDIIEQTPEEITTPSTGKNYSTPTATVRSAQAAQYAQLTGVSNDQSTSERPLVTNKAMNKRFATPPAVSSEESSSSPWFPRDKVANPTSQQSKQHKRKISDCIEEDYVGTEWEKAPKKKTGQERSMGPGSQEQLVIKEMRQMEVGPKKKLSKKRAEVRESSDVGQQTIRGAGSKSQQPRSREFHNWGEERTEKSSSPERPRKQHKPVTTIQQQSISVEHSRRSFTRTQQYWEEQQPKKKRASLDQEEHPTAVKRSREILEDQLSFAVEFNSTTLAAEPRELDGDMNHFPVADSEQDASEEDDSSLPNAEHLAKQMMARAKSRDEDAAERYLQQLVGTMRQWSTDCTRETLLARRQLLGNVLEKLHAEIELSSGRQEELKQLIVQQRQAVSDLRRVRDNIRERVNGRCISVHSVQKQLTSVASSDEAKVQEEVKQQEQRLDQQVQQIREERDRQDSTTGWRNLAQCVVM